jgi:hypothetical protein
MRGPTRPVSSMRQHRAGVKRARSPAATHAWSARLPLRGGRRVTVLAVAKRAKKPALPAAVRAYLSVIGKIGGNIGGRAGAQRRGHLGGTARAKALNATERSAAASQAATSRWSKLTKEQRKRHARKLAKARWSNANKNR